MSDDFPCHHHTADCQWFECRLIRERDEARTAVADMQRAHNVVSCVPAAEWNRETERREKAEAEVAELKAAGADFFASLAEFERQTMYGNPEWRGIDRLRAAVSAGLADEEV